MHVIQQACERLILVRRIVMKRLMVAAVLVLAMVSSCVVAQAYTEEHLRAAEETLISMGIEDSLSDTLDSMLEVQLQQNPDIVPFADVLRTFLQKHMGWAYLKDYFIEIYAEAFTEQELKDITAFYRSETGRKLVELTPTLMNKGMALGQEIVMEHMPELQQMILEQLQSTSSGQ